MEVTNDENSRPLTSDESDKDAVISYSTSKHSKFSFFYFYLIKYFSFSVKIKNDQWK